MRHSSVICCTVSDELGRIEAMKDSHIIYAHSLGGCHVQLDAQETRKDEVADFIARRMADLEAMAAEVQR
jgi:hypothetical protein